MRIHADLDPDPDPQSCLMQNIIRTCFKNSLKIVYVPVSVPVPVPILLDTVSIQMVLRIVKIQIGCCVIELCRYLKKLEVLVILNLFFSSQIRIRIYILHADPDTVCCTGTSLFCLSYLSL